MQHTKLKLFSVLTTGFKIQDIQVIFLCKCVNAKLHLPDNKRSKSHLLRPFLQRSKQIFFTFAIKGTNYCEPAIQKLPCRDPSGSTETNPS